MVTTGAVGERRFRVMASDAHLLVVGGPPGLVDEAERRVFDLESRWTRFHPSEVTALNGRPGEPVDVSEETLRLVEASRTAWESTDGRFDPTILPSLRAAGYDRSIEEIDQESDRPAGRGAPSPGLGGVFVWPELGRVMLPDGVEIDPGGIGKGLAADLVADELVQAGADGALVNLGGDLRVVGRPPQGDEWVISIDDPVRPGAELARISLSDGGVATSSRIKRRWRRAGLERHHLIDPRTGEPADTDVVSVTAVAGLAWWAEATTKSLLVAGSQAGFSSLHEASAIAVLADGTWRATEDLVGAVVRS